MVIKIILSNRALYSTIFIGLLILISPTLVSVTTNPGHSANEIIVTINSKTMNLQEAFENNFLKDGAELPDSDGTINPIKNHSGDSLQIYIKDTGKMSIQEAINQKKSFCQATPNIFDWLSNFFGHNADQISFIDGETLQEKINTQQFCSYQWEALDDWGECSKGCGGGTSKQTVFCKRSDEANVADTFCSETKPIDSRICNTHSCENCSDGLKNQGEAGVDCGGPCSPCEIYLVNNLRTKTDCINAGGTMVQGSGGNVCKFSQASCPGGWSASGDTATTSQTCKKECLVADRYSRNRWIYEVRKTSTCTTGGHSFSGKSQETCSYCAFFSWGKKCDCIWQGTCTATITQIGCY